MSYRLNLLYLNRLSSAVFGYNNNDISVKTNAIF